MAKDLYTTLSEMDSSLFEDTDESYVWVTKNDQQVHKDAPSHYCEDVSPNIAKQLLQAGEFDPECTYQLIFDIGETTLVKLNPKITEEDEQRALDLDPNTTCLRRTMYTLDSPEDVQSYSDLRTEYVMGAKPKTPPTNSTYMHLLHNESKANISWTLDATIAVIIVLAIIGLILLYSVLNGGGVIGI